MRNPVAADLTTGQRFHIKTAIGTCGFGLEYQRFDFGARYHLFAALPGRLGHHRL